VRGWWSIPWLLRTMPSSPFPILPMPQMIWTTGATTTHPAIRTNVIVRCIYCSFPSRSQKLAARCSLPMADAPLFVPSTYWPHLPGP